MKKTTIVSAFPGCGKSYASKNHPDKEISDSDSSKFDKSDFPANYIKHIKSLIGKKDIVFVSSHKDVREALVKNNIKFALVYPTIEQKDTYIKRYIERGSLDAFVKLISDNWNAWIKEMYAQQDCYHHTLSEGKYMNDIIDRFL